MFAIEGPSGLKKRILVGEQNQTDISGGGTNHHQGRYPRATVGDRR